MANPKKRVPENTPGDFFVDSTCIDCDTCRQIAPQVFGEAPGTSFVKAHWDRNGWQLAASEDYCWYSWPQQAESMERLADYPFEWVLPGHGQRVRLPAAEMRAEVLRLAGAMRCGER